MYVHKSYISMTNKALVCHSMQLCDIWFKIMLQMQQQKYLFDIFLNRLIQIYWVFMSKTNINTNIFKLTKKGKYKYYFLGRQKKGEYKYEYEYLDWYLRIQIWLQIFVTHRLTKCNKPHKPRLWYIFRAWVNFSTEHLYYWKQTNLIF